MTPTSSPRGSWTRTTPPTAHRVARPGRPRPVGRSVGTSAPERTGDPEPTPEPGVSPPEGPDGDVVSFFTRYAAALDADDLPAVAATYAEPTFVVTDDAGIVVSRHAEVVTFFRGVLAEHRERGLVAAHPTVERVEALTERLLDAVVRWSYADADGRVAFVDKYRYLLRSIHPGRLLIQTTVVLEGPRAAE